MRTDRAHGLTRAALACIAPQPPGLYVVAGRVRPFVHLALVLSLTLCGVDVLLSGPWWRYPLAAWAGWLASVWWDAALDDARRAARKG